MPTSTRRLFFDEADVTCARVPEAATVRCNSGCSKRDVVKRVRRMHRIERRTPPCIEFYGKAPSVTGKTRK